MKKAGLFIVSLLCVTSAFAGQGDEYISLNGYRNRNGIFENNTYGDSAQREESSSRHGNGVGLYNVHTRIQLRFGKEYGLVIRSEPDEGTCVTVHLPAIHYSQDIERILDGKIGGRSEARE